MGTPLGICFQSNLRLRSTAEHAKHAEAETSISVTPIWWATIHDLLMDCWLMLVEELALSDR